MKIPADTQSFHYHNENPLKLHTTDCVIRAISAATRIHWKNTLASLVALSMEYCQVPNEKKLYEKYLASIGWEKHPQPRKTNGTKFTAAEFAKVLNGVPAIAHVGGHHTSFLNEGKLWDTHDCSSKCVGNYWTKQD